MKRFLALATLALLLAPLPSKAQSQWPIGAWVEIENTGYWLELRKPRVIQGGCYIFNGMWIAKASLDYCESRLSRR